MVTLLVVVVVVVVVVVAAAAAAAVVAESRFSEQLLLLLLLSYVVVVVAWCGVTQTHASIRRSSTLVEMQTRCHHGVSVKSEVWLQRLRQGLNLLATHRHTVCQKRPNVPHSQKASVLSMAADRDRGTQAKRSAGQLGTWPFFAKLHGSEHLYSNRGAKEGVSWLGN